MNVTMKDRKELIFEKLQEAEQKIKQLSAGRINPVEEMKKAEVKKSIESAKEAVASNIFSEELNKKYNDVVIAIEAGEARIKELFGIEKELMDLTIAINAHKDTITEIEEEAVNKKANIQGSLIALKEELEEEIRDLRVKFATTEKELRENAANLKMQLEKERKREAEEYEYNLNRERTKNEDAYEDELAQREAVIAAREEASLKLLEEANDKLNYYTELEEKVAEIPNLLSEAKAAGALEKEKELGKEYGYKKAMAEKEHEYHVSRLEDKLESLEKAVEDKDERIASLEEKLDAAYAKMETLAGKTVEATGGVKILGQSPDTRK